MYNDYSVDPYSTEQCAEPALNLRYMGISYKSSLYTVAHLMLQHATQMSQHIPGSFDVPAVFFRTFFFSFIQANSGIFPAIHGPSGSPWVLPRPSTPS